LIFPTKKRFLWQAPRCGSKVRKTHRSEVNINRVMTQNRTPSDIEVLFVKVHVFVLLLFASLPDCSQNQTAVSYTLCLLSDF
jgi:hypothetical protein